MDDEAELIRRMQSGDLAAFERLFEQHRRGLLAYVTGMLNDPSRAQDVVQECFVELARHMNGIHPGKGVAGWLHRVARNRAVDVLRQRRKECPAPAELQGGPAGTETPTPLCLVLRDEQHRLLNEAVQSLGDKDREVVLLRYYAGLSFKEAANVLGCPLGTALWRGHQALRRLRRILEGGE